MKRVVVENVADDGYAVLNAADPLVRAMAAVCPGKVVLFAPDESVVAGHRPALFVRGGRIRMIAETDVDVIGLAEMPFVHGGVGFQIENALAAIGACWGLGISWEDIHRGLTTFRGDADECPARFNVLEAGESTVIVDYAHNPSALEAMIAGLSSYYAMKPLLGICFGLQMLNVDHGGTLVQHLLPMPVNHSAGKAVAVAHSVTVEPETKLAEWMRLQDEARVSVNSSHHQAVGIVGPVSEGDGALSAGWGGGSGGRHWSELPGRGPVAPGAEPGDAGGGCVVPEFRE